MIIGLPNAGKTTYSEKYDNVYHLDDYAPNKFVRCNKAVEEAGGDVVVEGIYNTASQRKELLTHAKGRNICIWLDTPLEVCLKRGVHARAPMIVQKGSRLFEPPTYAEGWDEIIVIR